jgi:O-6-methylguanine DNA methyltransferase
MIGTDSDRLQAVVDTPFGRFSVAATAQGLCAVAPLGSRTTAASKPAPEAAPHVETEPGAAHAHLGAATTALRAYCAGDPSPYGGALDLAGSEFRLRVLRRLLGIPFGAQVTYGAIARELGVPGEARAVGQAIAANPIAILVPCHRVVGADGTQRGYAWGLDLKGRLLTHELRIG